MGVTVATWNVRWMASPRTDKAAVKRAVLLAGASVGAIACLQEAHWRASGQGVWARLLPAVAIASSPGREGPGRGVPGGVA
eukprot:15431355-Alexandrium_andersonii.AAC.1